MTEQFNEFGAWLFDHLVPLSLELALLAGLVLLAIRLLRIQSSAIRHLFWVLVLIKPIVGFAVSSPISLYSFVFPVADGPVVESASIFAAVSVAANPAVTTPQPASQIQGAELGLFGLFALAWLAVALLLVSRLLVGFGALLYLRRTASLQHEGPLCDALATASDDADYRRVVRVATSDAVQSPLLTGVLRPLILFPTQLADKLQQEQLVMILVHELSHLQRLDNLTLLLQRLVQSALFFHPVVWLCGSMLRREAEQACDDAVIRVTGRSTQYADGLARVAEMARVPTGRSLPMNAFAATESHLSMRIKRLLGDRLGSISMSSRVIGLLTLALLGFFCLPTVSAQQGRDAEETLLHQLAEAVSQIDDPEFVRIAGTTPTERTEEDTRYLRMRVQEALTVVAQPQDPDSTHYLVPHSAALAKITFNPAGTNSKRFAILGLQLAFGDVDDDADEPFSSDEVDRFSQAIALHAKQMQAAVLGILRTKTIDDLESNRIDLVFEEIRTQLEGELANKYRDALGDRAVKLKAVWPTDIIIQ